MPNPYINNPAHSEQDLIESLITEAIDIHAETFYYIPRKLVNPDEILGEDRLSKFKHAYPIDAYFENATNFDGQGAFIQRYGGLVDYSATLLISRRRWQELVGQHGTTILPNRPVEGDLIYYPLTDSLFQIMYVDDKNPFAQLGDFYTWRLTIELHTYASEEIKTDLPEINAFQTLKTFDINADRSVWGGVEKVEVLDGGEGYLDAPTLEIESLAGHGAVLEVVMGEGSVKEIKVLDPGEGYSDSDELVVTGFALKPAQLKLDIRTQIGQADGQAANEANVEFGKENIVNFDDPFGS